MPQPDDVGAMLERYRNWLRILAHGHLQSLVRRRLDSSDIVQQTMVRAVQGFKQLRVQEPGAVAAWLRQILARTMADAVRDQLRERRDIRQEQVLDAQLDQSASGLAGLLAAADSSPSQKAMEAELHLRLADALMMLPEPMREAVVLKHCQGWTIAQIGDHLERTPAAVASLLRRGLQQLRSLLHEDTP